MPDTPATPSPPEPVPAPAPLERGPSRFFRDLFALRRDIPLWQTLLFSALCIVFCFGLWWYVTRGPYEERILTHDQLPSPAETFGEWEDLVNERNLEGNIYVTLTRVVLGFGLATVVGIPVGILCGCFTRVDAFFAPLTLFGRNIPIAALIGVTFALFGIGEFQKIMFIFIACVAFIIADTARAIREVGSTYVDTAYTLGASRRQVVLKVLVPLAMPSIFNMMRLLFGLAFGYIMLAEVVKFGDEAGGLGDLIATSQRRSIPEHIYLILLIIPIIALLIDRALYWIQKELFPHRYGGVGILNQCVRASLHGWEDLKNLVVKPAAAPAAKETPKEPKPT